VGGVPLSHVLAFGAVLFLVGLVGFLSRRNFLTLFMSVEIMLNAVNVNLIAFSRSLGDTAGQAFAIFVITVAAAEVAVGLAILILMYRSRGRVLVQDWRALRDN
jgi:NADH-quinone oxidoreductase subunit K